MESDPVFTRFVERRARLLERLDSTRARFDRWIENHRTQNANVSELAQLEGLLAERRTHLNELLRLDDSLMEHLIVLLGKASRNPGP